MVPEGWQIKPFGEFATLKRGYDLPASARQPGTVPIFSAVGQIGFHDRAKVRGPGVVTGRNGTIGKVCYTTEDFWPLNTTLYVNDFHGNDPQFVYRFLEYFHLERFSAGTGVRTLNRNVVHEKRVVVPPPAEQAKIVNVLDQVDVAIRAARAVVEQTLKVQRGIESRWLTRGLGPVQNTAGPPASWRLKPLREVCQLRNGHGFTSRDWAESGLPIIRIQNLRGSTRFKYFAGVAKSSWLVEPGDLLFAWAGKRGVSLGPYLWQGPRGVLNQHIFQVRPARGVEFYWLFRLLAHLTRRLENLTHGFKKSLQHFRRRDLDSTLVAVPPPLEQRLIARHCQKLAEVDRAQQASLDRLLGLRQELLRELMSGRLHSAELRDDIRRRLLDQLKRRT